jgi:hypothetical protein
LLHRYGLGYRKETYSEGLLEKLKEISGKDDFSFINTLKDRDRGMIFLLLEK